MKNICEYCKKEFYTTHIKYRFCSCKCYYNNNRKILVCPVCNKKFIEQKNSKQIFCSVKCRSIKILPKSIFIKGHTPWNKGIPCREATKEKLRKRIPIWNIGKKLSEETKEKMSKSHIGLRPSLETIKKLRESHRGEKQSPERIAKRIKKGKDHYNWQDGKTYEPYTSDFNQQLKDKIRVRDNFICQLCGIPELECNRRLPIHHIDYDKKNSKESNLIALCNKCNVKVNYKRQYWINYFNNEMEEKYERI